MLPQYSSIFERLRTAYELGYGRQLLEVVRKSLGRAADFVPEGAALAAVSQAVGNSIAASELPVRPDGRLFITIVLHQLVALPVMQPDAPTRKQPTEVQELLQRDLDKIVPAAVRSAQAGDRKYLAASHMLWGMAEVLDELELKSFRIWDREES